MFESVSTGFMKTGATELRSEVVSTYRVAEMKR